MSSTGINIDLSESFEHLPNAPIVEAVIHWRARSERKLEPDTLLEQLKEELPDYPNAQRQQELGVGAEFGPEGSSVRQHHNWHGFRFESADKLHVAQFTRDGFVFSRLKPYEDWEEFEAEAQRLWQVYRQLADPSEIQRLGVRFINLISTVDPDDLADLLALPPRNPEKMQLPLKGFMHQSTFEVPGHTRIASTSFRRFSRPIRRNRWPLGLYLTWMYLLLDRLSLTRLRADCCKCNGLRTRRSSRFLLNPPLLVSGSNSDDNNSISRRKFSRAFRCGTGRSAEPLSPGVHGTGH